MKRSIANAIKSGDKTGQYALVSHRKQDLEVSAGWRLRNLAVDLWRGYPRLSRMLSSFGQSVEEDAKASLTPPHTAMITQRDAPLSQDTLWLAATWSPARLESEVL
jgi:hypothetical protein